jgi:hypothetical protein
LQERIARIADPYGVPVYSGGGFDGLKGKRQIATRAMERQVAVKSPQNYLDAIRPAHGAPRPRVLREGAGPQFPVADQCGGSAFWALTYLITP